MDVCAFHSCPESSGYRAPERHEQVLTLLETRGLVTRKSQADPTFFLTEHGIRRVVSCTQAMAPHPVFKVRDNIPLSDCSNYEVLKLMESAGWEWKLWVVPSSRSRKQPNLFRPYVRGGPKHWYSSKTLNKPYLQTLLDAERLFDAGLPEVPHGRPISDYQRILRGDFSLSTRALRDVDDLPADIEGGDAAVRKRAPRASSAAAASRHPAAAAGHDVASPAGSADIGGDVASEEGHSVSVQ
jgi:hypothetical protein